jgi:hypothetical protein
MDAERSAEDVRLVAADLVPEVEQVALELLARDDGAVGVGERFGARHKRRKSVLSAPAAADFLSNPLAARHLRCPIGKQKPA